jgi:hypothetical protein
MKWYLGYFKNLPPASHNWAKVRGTIGHRMLEREHYHRAELVRDVCMEYEQGKDDGKHLQHPAPILYPNDIDKEIDILESMIGGYRKMIKVYGGEIIEKEKLLECNILKRPFSGTMDAVTLFPDTPTGKVEVFDYKFGRPFHRNAMDRNLQFGIYFLMCKELGITVNRFWWIAMQELEPYRRSGKWGEKGDIRGQGFWPIRITDFDVEYIENMVSGALYLIDEMSGKSQLHQSSYGGFAPCNLCDYEAHCPKFRIGTKEPFDVQAMSTVSQEQLERKMFNV